jgi:hypothetical protein
MKTPEQPPQWPGSPDDYVLVRRGVLIGAAIILEKAVQRLFASGTVEAYTHMRDAARGPAVEPPAKKKRWLE